MTPPNIDHDADSSMPAWFVGHGSPMNAMDNHQFSRLWSPLPTLKAMLEAAVLRTGVSTAVMAPRTDRKMHTVLGRDRS
ncbi:protein of unknown function (plasmid) [Candidatus Methylocalor cossyra]|uniref:Uncharacterized protein n=2 Tax=Candidatus Methylocalor cossyra TaxID=3108543 RepID=A0ABM9NMW2_9GAMM